MKLFEISKNKADEWFLFGHCASFAIALQEVLGGEIFVLSRRGVRLHAYLMVNGKSFDVRGRRSTHMMAISIVGSFDDFITEGPFPKDQLPFPVKDQKIQQAREYIAENKALYTVTI